MAENMKLQSTVITEKPSGVHVAIVYADNSDFDLATASVVIRLPIVANEHPHPVTARAEALERVRQLVAEEIEKIAHPKRIPRK